MTPEDGPISQAEMIEIFGEQMPLVAVNLLWNAKGDKTVGEIRAELRCIARIRAARLEALEEAAKIAETFAGSWRSVSEKARDPDEAHFYETMHDEVDRLAAAIRERAKAE